MARYRCEFWFDRPGGAEKRAVYSNDGPAAFANGFWLNDDLRLSKASDCRFWIPPAQIRYVMKEVK